MPDPGKNTRLFNTGNFADTNLVALGNNHNMQRTIRLFTIVLTLGLLTWAGLTIGTAGTSKLSQHKADLDFAMELK